MTTDLFGKVAGEYEQLASDMGEPSIDVRQPPKLWINLLELTVSGKVSVTSGGQLNASMQVAGDLAKAIQDAYGKAPNLEAVSKKFQPVKTNDVWFVAYGAGGKTKLLFEIKDAGAVDENSPNKCKVIIKLLEPAWQKEYVPGCVGKYSLWSALTAYAIRFENHVQQKHR